MRLPIIAVLALTSAVALRAHSSLQTPTAEARQKALNALPGGDAAVGKPIFEKVCATCHMFGSVGKTVGPELTTIAAKLRRPELIEAILFPSRAIADQYQPVMIQTKDGDVFVGLVLKENARAVTLVTGDKPDAPIEILKSKIQERGKSTTSAMPEHLLDAYSDEQVIGLLAYLLGGPK